MSRSQIGQDLSVLKFYNNKREGYFVEVGATDGIHFSNTYHLEKDYAWRGICVEPVPHNYAKLCKNRPTAHCSDYAVYNTSGSSVDFDVAGSNVLSGITSHISAKWAAHIGTNKTTIKVDTITLADLLDKYNAPNFIEYLSLDTEGSEYEILKVFDYNKYVFGLIDVEHNSIEPQRTQIRELLVANGYIYIGPNRWDDCYRHNSVNVQ